MRTQQVEVYQFNELSEDAKEHARDWYRGIGTEIAWVDEMKESVRAFCSEFNTSLTDWTIGAYCHNYFDSDAEAANFRGFTLKQAEKMREEMPTGYCLDSTLRYTFADSFKASGDAFAAFKDALDKAAKDCQNDCEEQQSDEYIDELLIANEYEFTAGGKRFRI